MKKQKGLILLQLIIVFLIIIIICILPIMIHQRIIRTQNIMAKTGIEMSYWDIFWTNPEIRFNQGEIMVKRPTKDIISGTTNQFGGRP